MNNRRLFSIASLISTLTVDIRINARGRRKGVCTISDGTENLWSFTLELPVDARLPASRDSPDLDPLQGDLVEAHYQRKPLSGRGELYGWLWMVGPSRFEISIRTSTGACLATMMVNLCPQEQGGSRDPLFIETSGCWDFGEG